MRDLVILLVHVITIISRLVGPGGVRAVVAESVLAKHQLLILNRSRRRPQTSASWIESLPASVHCGFSRVGFLGWRSPLNRRPSSVSIARWYSANIGCCFHRIRRRSLVRKGPTADLIRAVVEMKQRNPTLGMSSHRRPDQPGFGNLYS
jgi:hypothetical protein